MSQPKVTGKRILLVDDDREFGQMVNESARERGMSLDAVRSGQLLGRLDALQYYDVVVMNYDLESVTGLEIAEYMQRYLPAKQCMLVTSSQPWQDVAENPPNVRAVFNQWDGIDELLEAADKLG